MPEPSPTSPAVETDERFPSGPWVGFFLQPELISGRVRMELDLTFAAGRVSGDGIDPLGVFTIAGAYDVDSGEVNVVKSYLGRHDVDYRGFNEGKGIWGVWRIAEIGFRGGFHIWPKDMPDPTTPRLAAEEDEPVEVVTFEEETAPATMPMVDALGA